MGIERQPPVPPVSPEGDEGYFEEDSTEEPASFDAHLLRESAKTLPMRRPLVFSAGDTVTEAMRGMQRERRGCVLITEDGTLETELIGILTERDVLFRIVDRGRNPQTLPLGEVMTRDPESLPEDSSVAWVLNKMAIGGFRHVPIVDSMGRPAFVVSVRDVVQFLVEMFPGEVLNLPPDPGGPRSVRREGA